MNFYLAAIKSRQEDRRPQLTSGQPYSHPGTLGLALTQLPGFASFILQQRLLMILGIYVCSFLAVSCLILCSKTAELIINTYQATAEKQVPKQRIQRASVAHSFQNLIAHLFYSFRSSSFEMLKLLKKK